MNYYKTIIRSPIGNLELSFENDFLIKICFVEQEIKNQSNKIKASKIVEYQLNCYFKDSNFKFNLPLKINGTSFQKNVWEALEKTPAGETITYGDLAKELKSSPRAIGNACRANPIPIIIPCHRVIGKNGLIGYSGEKTGKSLDIKKWLLMHELK